MQFSMKIKILKYKKSIHNKYWKLQEIWQTFKNCKNQEWKQNDIKTNGQRGETRLKELFFLIEEWKGS